MNATIELLLGINIVDDYRKGAKAQFTPDGIILPGELKSCVNFRLYKDGTGEVRNGQTVKLAITDCQGGFVNASGTVCLYVDGTDLKSLASAMTSATTLRSNLHPKRRMMFWEHNAKIFMGNGEEMLKYENGTVSVWGDDDNISAEFELPQRVYRTPPLTNIIMGYRDRMWAKDGRFALYSDSSYPDRFRSAWNLPHSEIITAMSFDVGGIYLHGLNSTTYYGGAGPDDMSWSDPLLHPIGAIKHGAILVEGLPIIMSKQGWAICQGGNVQPLDESHFRLDLSDTAEAFMGYDPTTKEIFCSVRQ